MNRAAIKDVCGAVVLMAISATLVHAQESSPASETSGTVYVGGQFGVHGGSSLWSPYDLIDGSGSHFGGLSIGFTRRVPSGVVFGGEADLSFGAEPVHGNGVFSEAPELFGTVRGR